MLRQTDRVGGLKVDYAAGGQFEPGDFVQYVGSTTPEFHGALGIVVEVENDNVRVKFLNIFDTRTYSKDRCPPRGVFPHNLRLVCREEPHE